MAEYVIIGGERREVPPKVVEAGHEAVQGWLAAGAPPETPEQDDRASAAATEES